MLIEFPEDGREGVVGEGVPMPENVIDPPEPGPMERVRICVGRRWLGVVGVGGA